MPKPGFTVIELLVVIAVIAVLAALALTSVSGVSRQRQIEHARVTLKQIDGALASYYKLYGRWPVDPALAPPARTAAAMNACSSQLNKNILKNLKRDWGEGNFNSFSSDSVQVDSGIDLNDGMECFVDPWGRPYCFKVQVGMRAGKLQLQAVYVYSAGEDGQDDFADLEAWLAAGHGWLVGDDYQIRLAQTQPQHVNVDNVYPAAQ